MTFPDAGFYRLRLDTVDGEGCFIDKIVLSSSGYVPTGMGPGETVVGLDSQEPQQEASEVVLPPAWAFGVLYGG